MTDQYLWRKGDRELGPFQLSEMRKMVRSGALGRFQNVSKDGGDTWEPASSFAEIWESTELTTLPPPPPAVDATPTIIVPATTPIDLELSLPPVSGVPPMPPTRARGLGLAGFITGTAGLVLALAPFLIWITRYESGYAAVPLSFLFSAASITGLAMSAVAVRRRPGGFATTGLIVGICGCALGLITSLGWAVSHDPREDWIRRQTATSEADVQLARRDFTAALRRYRDHLPDDDHAAALERVTKDLMVLTQAHKRLLIAAASTPTFGEHFRKLDQLRTAYNSFREAVKLQDDLTAQEAIDRIGQSVTTLKELLDLLDLEQTRQITMDSAQAKFRDY